MKEKRRWLVCFILAIIAGLLFGSNFDPPQLLQDEGNRGQDHSTDPFDYVLSHFCGILLLGVLVLAVYIPVMGQQRHTPLEIVMPAVFAGVLWAIAQVAWFKANEELSMVVAFPIISTLPGFMSIAIGMAFFGEFRTRRARLFALAASCLQIPGVVLIALSKPEAATQVKHMQEVLLTWM